MTNLGLGILPRIRGQIVSMPLNSILKNLTAVKSDCVIPINMETIPRGRFFKGLKRIFDTRLSHSRMVAYFMMPLKIVLDIDHASDRWLAHIDALPGVIGIADTPQEAVVKVKALATKIIRHVKSNNITGFADVSRYDEDNLIFIVPSWV